MKRVLLAVFLAAAMLLTAGCGILNDLLGTQPETTPVQQPASQPAQQPAQQPAETPVESPNEQPDTEPIIAEPSGEAVILFTSDVHCGIDQGFGYAGLQQIRDYLLSRGDEVILVDDGDAIQGEPIGTLSKGEAIIDLMNAVGYEIAIPGNHEFDYGMDRFLELTGKADFTYVSCNINKNGELVFAPYVMKTLAGHQVAFVGVTTPKSLTTSTPRNFQDENGEFIYSFYQDNSGRTLSNAVQKAVDNARVEGAEIVVLMAHLGNEEECRPWTYADVISNTTGIDILLDGHSHDTEQVVMRNRDGKDVTRVACGTKLNCIGYCRINAEGKLDAGVYSWPNETPAPAMLGIRNQMSAAVTAASENMSVQLGQVIASTKVELTISDPVAVDNLGNPVRMVRRAETNLGDLCADAYRIQTGADIALVNGGAIRVSIPAGDITLGDIMTVYPFGNNLCVIEATGIQILDALEWGARSLPGECGGFLQVSGLSYEVHTYMDETTYTDDNGMFKGLYGARRVQNVLVNGEPIAFYRTYSVAGPDYILREKGDGFTMFSNNKVLQDNVKLDNQALMDYLTEYLGGVVGDEYGVPYGEGRITIVESAP
ncbi:MAG: bifunctional metallophosphatase/5'-nucleotidase [Clostridia bacterium]